MSFLEGVAGAVMVVMDRGNALLLALAFSGALITGDRIRANYCTEDPAGRSFRLKAAVVCLAVAIVAGLLALVLCY